MAYAARFIGKPGFGAVCVDKPEYAKETAKSIAGWVRSGATVERVSIQTARDGMAEYCTARMGYCVRLPADMRALPEKD